MNINKLIAVDVDGVLLNYNKKFKEVYKLIFNEKLISKVPNAYHATTMYGLTLTNEELDFIFNSWGELGAWKTMDALAGAVNGVNKLVDYGFEVVCITCMQEKFKKDRFENLLNLGFKIEDVFAVNNQNKSDKNPKKYYLELLKPLVFVDDIITNFLYTNISEIKYSLIEWDCDDNPNINLDRKTIFSTHKNFKDFSDYFINNLDSFVK